jgi:hypothetical protein
MLLFLEEGGRASKGFISTDNRLQWYIILHDSVVLYLDYCAIDIGINLELPMAEGDHRPYLQTL